MSAQGAGKCRIPTVEVKVESSKRTDEIAMKSKRTLIIVPILHSRADLGSLCVEQQLALAGKPRGEDHEQALRGLWKVIEVQLLALIEQLKLPFPKLRLYQDGLPVCGFEAEIVASVAASGSDNFRLLSALIDKGACLTGTESPALLRAEYELQQAGTGDAGSTSADRAAKDILCARDAFIARRIDETLAVDELGVLFIGMAHDVARHLDEDVHARLLVSIDGAGVAG